MARITFFKKKPKSPKVAHARALTAEGWRRRAGLKKKQDRQR